MLKVLHISYSARVAILVLAAAVMLYSGCGDPDRSRILGTWDISGGEPYLDRVDSVEMDDTEAMPPRVVIRFFHSGGLETETRISGQISTKTGTWKFKSFDESNELMLIECNLTNQITEHEITFESPDKITLVPPNMAGLTRKLTFVRK